MPDGRPIVKGLPISAWRAASTRRFIGAQARIRNHSLAGSNMAARHQPPVDGAGHVRLYDVEAQRWRRRVVTTAAYSGAVPAATVAGTGCPLAGGERDSRDQGEGWAEAEEGGFGKKAAAGSARPAAGQPQ